MLGNRDIEAGRFAVGRTLAGMALLVAAVAAVGWIALSVLNALLGVVSYLIVGALVVGGGVYLYRRTRRAVAPGTRTRNRIEAAARTHQIRNR
jgi:hypothetical protein